MDAVGGSKAVGGGGWWGPFANGPRCVGHRSEWDGDYSITGPVVTGPYQADIGRGAGPFSRTQRQVGEGGSRTAPAAWATGLSATATTVLPGRS